MKKIDRMIITYVCLFIWLLMIAYFITLYQPELSKQYVYIGYGSVGGGIFVCILGIISSLYTRVNPSRRRAFHIAAGDERNVNIKDKAYAGSVNAMLFIYLMIIFYGVFTQQNLAIELGQLLIFVQIITLAIFMFYYRKRL